MKKDALSQRLDEFFSSLISESNGATTIEGDEALIAPKIGFIDRLRLFEAGIKWASVKNKVDTEDGVTDEFGKLRRGYASGGARKRGPAAAAPSRPNGAGGAK